MKKLVACSIASLSLLVPAAGLAQAVCEQLQIAKIDGPTPFPNIVTVPTPDIRELAIQVYTTKPVSDAGEGLTHKCEIAHDLWEVDRMLRDVGFGGYTAATPMPIFVNTAVKQVGDNDVETVRNVVREILNPAGIAEPAIEALTANADLYNERVLNVYYVHGDPGTAQTGVDFLSQLTGMHIRDENGQSAKMIFVGDGAKSDTVAHEFGHAFSAGHVNFWDFEGNEYCVKFLPHPGTSTPDINMECEFSNANYMWAASEADRADLIDAQKERMMRNEHSIIFEYSPSNDSLKCPDFNSNPNTDTPENDACPRMGQP